MGVLQIFLNATLPKLCLAQEILPGLPDCHEKVGSGHEALSPNQNPACQEGTILPLAASLHGIYNQNIILCIHGNTLSIYYMHTRP